MDKVNDVLNGTLSFKTLALVVLLFFPLTMAILKMIVDSAVGPLRKQNEEILKHLNEKKNNTL